MMIGPLTCTTKHIDRSVEIVRTSYAILIIFAQRIAFLYRCILIITHLKMDNSAKKEVWFQNR